MNNTVRYVNHDVWAMENPDHESLVACLRDTAEWSNFAKSLCEWLDKHGCLTDKQTAAARALLDRYLYMPNLLRATQAGNGETRLAFNGGYTTKGRAILRNGAYIGRLTTHGGFMATKTCTEADLASLRVIEADVHAAAIEYGKATGRCGCCGRKLTNPVSVERGIGPICEARYF